MMLFCFRFFSLAATLQGRIVGIIVAETKELGQVLTLYVAVQYSVAPALPMPGVVNKIIGRKN